MTRRLRILAWTLLLPGVTGGSAVRAQTTQGLISGQVLDAIFGTPLPRAIVTWTNLNSAEKGDTAAHGLGLYTLPLLSPGIYELRADVEGYQPQVVAEQELSVASRLDVTFRLRPDYAVWGNETDSFVNTRNERLVHFYAADLTNLESAKVELLDASKSNLNATLSYVIDSSELDALPLAGRDAYALLIALPGVTAANGTLRGLGLSVNGQRPSSSNFLVDGLEANNEATTGNLIPAVPEELQEYRISTNNFSAEYGRTSGFLANVITRAGTASWHGIGYAFLKNDVFNANGVRHPTQGLEDTRLPRLPLKEIEPGFHVGGPLGKRGWFASLAFDGLVSHSALDPSIYRLPTTAFVRSLTPNSNAANLMASLNPLPDAGNATETLVTLSPPARRQQFSAIPRIDRELGGSKRFFFRIAASRTAFPDFAWTPYRDFISPFSQDAAAFAAGLITTGPITNELRAGWNWDVLSLDRARPDVPYLFSFDHDLPSSPFKTLLPGAQVPYGFRNLDRTWQLLDNATWTRYKHTPKVGAGIVLRHLFNALDYFPSGDFGFRNLSDFAADRPDHVESPLSRIALPEQLLPNTGRTYQWTQFYAFAQDSYRVSSRLTFDYGIRYEYFGAPANTGPQKDAVVQLGQGGDFIQRLSQAALVPGASGNQEVFAPDRNNFAPRAGFSWRVHSGARPLLARGSYGIFYDRPFDNLWFDVRSNSLAYGTNILNRTQTTNYLNLPQVLANTPLLIQNGFPPLTLIQPGLRDGYVQSYFFGFEQALTSELTIDATFAGSLGRKLITTDIINRDYSLTLDQLTSANQSLRFDPQLTQIDYRANQGSSRYNSLSLVARYRSERVSLQAAYTWSHSIDNQTEPLAGEFFNLAFTNPVLSGGAEVQAAQFTRQFDSSSDRGNSDFDQRHNLVIFSYWYLPAPVRFRRIGALLRNWRLAEMAAFRTGFPFTVYAPVTNPTLGDPILINRASLALTGAPLYINQPVDGGIRLLDSQQFIAPLNGIGNTGRNEFRGPGVYNVDVSLSRSFAWHRLGDGGSLSIRADAFNSLNHANLNNPISVLSAPGFGIALFGRQDIRTGFPGSIPFDETGRQVQLSLHIGF